MDLSNLFFVALVTALTTTALVSDLRTRRLPNWLTVSGLALAVILHTVMGGFAGLGFALLGFVTGFGLLLILWLIGGAGGGDVKLMGALGAWLGASLTLRVFLVSTALAAVVTAAILLAGVLSRGFGHVQRRYLATGSAGQLSIQGSSGSDARNRRQRLRLMPYAVPVALGTWLVLAVAWHTSSLPW
jgi:prepilin peptidase CpaA